MSERVGSVSEMPAEVVASALLSEHGVIDAPRPVLPYPREISGKIVWRYAAPIVVVHVVALLALHPWFFSWTGTALCWVGIYFFGGIGIDLCYHRLLTHRSFRVPRWLEHAFVWVALCCLEDAPASWVATHRQHHLDSDETEDPHSPLVNLWWGHAGWLFVENRGVRSFSAYQRFARDVLEDPFYFWLQRSLAPLWIYLAHAALYFVAGFAAGYGYARTLDGAWQLGWSWLVWGALLRTVCVWHISWSVNSLTHAFGYRSFPTTDNSRNNWLVALLTSGEGWHNNHHHDPASATTGFRWWEFDLIYVFVQCLERIGLATHIILPRHIRAATAKATCDQGSGSS